MDGLVSVVVPVYNVKEYLAECINSIINQSYAYIEVILVDDGSTDGCALLCDQFALKDQRIKVIHKSNGGLSSARNAGIEESTGEFICFVDSDDYIKPDFIKKLYYACVDNDCQMAMCHYFSVVDDKEKVYERVRRENLIDGKEACERCISPQYIVAWNKIYSRSIIGEIRYPVGKIHEDVFTTYKFFYRVKKCAIINEQLYGYRLNLNGIAHCAYNLKRLDELKAIKEQISFYKEKNENELLKIVSLFYLEQSLGHLYMIERNNLYCNDLVWIKNDYIEVLSDLKLSGIKTKYYLFLLHHLKVWHKFKRVTSRIKYYLKRITKMV